MRKSGMFRKALGGSGMLMRPCAYDALSAILIERAGFQIVGTSGYAISASIIGQPDIGLVSSGEMLERVRTIVNAVSLPVDADIDTGYGNALNVYWTVRNFAWIGSAGVRLEDQTWPKRCGHMAGKELISRDEMVQKVKAAVKARDEDEPDLVIGARTDARSITGFDDVIERGIAYAKAGADYVYVEAPQTLKEVELLVKRTPAPIALNLIPGGKTPPFLMRELEQLGVRYVSIPMVCLYPAAKAMMKALKTLKETRDVGDMEMDWVIFNEIVGLDAWRRRELEFSTREEFLRRYGTANIDEIARKEASAAQRFWKKREIVLTNQTRVSV
jgi:2-methylisocitrate lyase-like PEP mutase family enzyme